MLGIDSRPRLHEGRLFARMTEVGRAHAYERPCAAAPFDPRFSPMLDSQSDAVSVAKRLRRQVVALEIEGSNPFAHPTHPCFPRSLEHGSGVPIDLGWP